MRNLCKPLATWIWTCAILLSAAASAYAQGDTVESARVLQALRKTYAGTQFTSVRQTPLPGIFEVVMGQQIAYTDASGEYFLFGNLMDMRSQVNLTQERMGELTRVDAGSLPLAQAIKVVKGNGSRVLYVFADPECGYCKQLERTLAGVDNATIYTFLYPVLGQRSAANAEAIWCSKDRAKAWRDHMTGEGSALLPTRCDAPIQRNLQLGESLGITGTPTIILAGGKRVPGAVPLERLNALLDESKAAMGGAK